MTDPQTVLPTTTLREVKELTERNGFAGYPVVTEENELVGIITGRDVRFVTDLNQPVSVYMTPKERLVTVREGEAREVVLAKMHEKRVEKALVVDDEFHLIGMITVKDFQKAERKPNACKDEQGRLRVGAAVGAGAGNEERVDALVAAGVDVLLIDSSHGHSEGVCSVSVKPVLNIRICKSSAATWQQLQVHALWQKLVAARLKSVSALVLSVRLVSLLA